MINDDLHIVHSYAAGLDLHKMQITASVRLCKGAEESPRCDTRSFATLSNGLEQMTSWLLNSATGPQRKWAAGKSSY